MQIKMFKRGRPTRIAIMFSCQLAFVLFGYDQGVFSGIVGNEHFLDVMGHPDDTLTGIIVAIYNLGCFSGCVLNFLIGDWLGRRRAMWFAMAWIIVGAVLQTSAFGVGHMLVGRYIAGIGTGIETSTVPMYQAELSEAHKRGKLVCSEPLFVGVGIVIAYFFDFGMSFVKAPEGIAWRLPIACQMLFAFMVIVLVFGLPESPRYCYQKGRNEEALQILCDVYDLPPEDPKIQREQGDVLETIQMEREHGEYKWRNILKRDKVQTGRRVLLAYGMQFMNQMGGINLVVYFVPTALETNVGLTRTLSLVIGGFVQVMFVIGSFYPTFFVDKVGRRKPMMWGCLGLALSMMYIAIMLSFNTQKCSAAAVAGFFTYMLIFGASVNCIPWCYVPEILPLHARAKGTAVGISSNWLWNFVIVMISPIIIQRIAWRGYLIFMATNLAFVPLVYFCYPETANLTLEEIDYIFIDDTTPAVKLSKQMREQRVKYGRRESFVQDTGLASRSGSVSQGTLVGRPSRDMTNKEENDIAAEHSEKV